MKKRTLIVALALVILTGTITMSGASGQSQSLVSRSYLAGIYWNDLKATVFSEVQKNTTYIYNDAVSRAGEGAGSSTFTMKEGTNGDTVTASVGCGLIWASGTGMVRSGTLVDATEGREVASGGVLAVGHRYLAGTDVALVVTSSSAQWMAEGKWTVTAGEPVLPFPDVTQGQWYYDDVAYVYQNGLFGSTGSGYFEPQSKMQRGMMATVLYRLAEKPTVNYSAVFTDVPAGQWYTDGTIWAHQMGVVTGRDNRFNPFFNVTRQEIAAMLYRYAEKLGCDMSQTASLSGFSDSTSVPDWSKDAISWAIGAGIIRGNNGALLPTGDASRAEVAAMFHRFSSWIQQQ